MVKKAVLHYAAMNYKDHRTVLDNLDSVIEMAKIMKNARDTVNGLYFGINAAKCDIKVGSIGGDDLYPGFVVEVTELEHGRLENALDSFFSIAGTPHYVRSSSNCRKALEEALQLHGKRFSTLSKILNPLTLLDGYRVVPA